MPNEAKTNQVLSPSNIGPEATSHVKRPDSSFVTVTLWVVFGVVLAACSGGSLASPLTTPSALNQIIGTAAPGTLVGATGADFIIASQSLGAITTFFGEGGFDVLTYDDVPINSDTIL